MTADDLTRLRLNAESAKQYKASHVHVLTDSMLALIDRVERAERERDEAIDSKDRWRLRAKSAQSELSDIRTTIGSGPERWTEADSISVYRTRAEDAESELAALRAAVEGLAEHIILPEQLRGLLTEGADDGQ